MSRATKLFVLVMSLVTGLMGIEHGLGEVLQGNVAPAAWVFPSWPNSAWFEILAGEPAMSVIPNLLVSGILSIFFSLLFIAWVILFVGRRNMGLVMVLLSFAMLLVGAGFGPPLVGILTSIVAFKVNSPLAWWHRRAAGPRRFLSVLWPYLFILNLLAWLLMFPGSLLIDHFLGISNPELFVPVVFVIDMAAFWLTAVSGLAQDSGGQQPVSGRQALVGN